jgi:predicted nucleic acid-binding protein
LSYLVDANVLSEPTRPDPDPGVVSWLRAHERELAVDPIILGEIRFGILLLPEGQRRQRLERWFDEGIRPERVPEKPREPPKKRRRLQEKPR